MRSKPLTLKQCGRDFYFQLVSAILPKKQKNLVSLDSSCSQVRARYAGKIQQRLKEQDNKSQVSNPLGKSCFTEITRKAKTYLFIYLLFILS